MDSSFSFDPNAGAEAAAAATGVAAIGFVMVLFWIVVGGLGFVLWLWALIDCIRREFSNPNDKILWIVLILLLWLIGPILYLIVGRKKGTIPAAK